MNSPTLREHDIRPSESASKQKALYESDVARLLEGRGNFVPVSCPACGSSEARHRFDKYSLAFVCCTTCETTYLSPRPSPQQLKNYYETSENYQYWADVIFPASEATRRDRIFRPRLQSLLGLVDKFGIERGSMLEVGPGFGTFCEEAMATSSFRRIVAIEPTPSLADACRGRGIEVLELPVEDAKVSEKFDVVCAFEVIEHLFSPGAFVSACAKLLRPGGMLVVTCPNGKGFDVEVLGAGSPAVDVEHLNYFNPASLRRLVEAHGFEVLEVQTPGKLDADIVRNRVLAGEAELTDPFMRRILIDEWERLGTPFQAFLSDNFLSSNLWLAARRR